MHRFYPKITATNLAPLRLIREQMQHFPDYLTSSECPYDYDVKEFLQSLAQGGGEGVVVEESAFIGQHGDKWTALENHATELFTELKSFGAKINTSNTSEKMSYFRTITSLLDKITSINERAMGLRHVSEFITTVIDILDNICTEDQRTEFMEQLRAAIGEAPKPEDYQIEEEEE